MTVLDRRGASRATVLLIGLLLGVVVSAPSADAAPSLSVSPTDGLDRDGSTTVRARGSGYDTSKGIYVAYCVVPAAGQAPSPCGGGADTSGTSGGSVWISDDPPRYGEGLAQPYGSGGSFDVQVVVTPTIGDVDCRETRCAVVTRNDHTRSSDRSQDVLVPVSFAAPAAPAAAPDPEPAPRSTPAPDPTPEPEPAADPAPEPSEAAAEPEPDPDPEPEPDQDTEPEPAEPDDGSVDEVADDSVDRRPPPIDLGERRPETAAAGTEIDDRGTGRAAWVAAGLLALTAAALGETYRRRRAASSP